MFKYIFGNPNNTSILISLVNAVLKDSDQPEITSATIQNPFNIKEFENGKESVIDIRIKKICTPGLFRKTGYRHSYPRPLGEGGLRRRPGEGSFRPGATKKNQAKHLLARK